jgi:hypothetical protein
MAAAIQMKNTSSVSVTDRLQRAADLIAEAADRGAELVVLPELFSTGLTYSEELYERTEPADGATVQWLHGQAAAHHVHLAGSLPVVDTDETYQAAFLVAPDGRQWRYDKQFPAMWERVFYREGRAITLADTDLGRIGLMIGRDAAHPQVWQRYAARVTLLLILHTQPDFSRAELHFPDDSRRKLASGGGLTAWTARHSTRYADDIPQQAAWLNVPVVSAGCTGTLETILPAPLFSVGALMSASPADWPRINGYSAADTRLIAPLLPQTRLINRSGQIQAQTASSGDSVLIERISLPDAPPQPQSSNQPAMQTPPLLYPLVDGLATGLLTLNYKRGVRRQWGARMAPDDPQTTLWLWALLAAGAIGAFVGWFLRGDT